MSVRVICKFGLNNWSSGLESLRSSFGKKKFNDSGEELIHSFKRALIGVFDGLRQGDMTVNEFYMKFVELSSYAYPGVVDQPLVIEQFMRRLRPAIRGPIAPLTFNNLTECVTAALRTEAHVEGNEKKNTNRGRGSDRKMTKKNQGQWTNQSQSSSYGFTPQSGQQSQYQHQFRPQGSGFNMGYSQGFQTPVPSGSQRGYNQGGGSGASTSYPSQGRGKAKAKSSAQAYALGGQFQICLEVDTMKLVWRSKLELSEYQLVSIVITTILCRVTIPERISVVESLIIFVMLQSVNIASKTGCRRLPALTIVSAACRRALRRG
ncbi:hypothetical protein G4B88_018053 [Cannabis sativa]|uniref:Retrotransposon gag domain-containing protein n=1 Tax=Cannabis sativa TaxID=3483 RepID=A0A7J6E9N8_CANSA|nr:hypothetical protein G4B88_018053 [Cannabis sativa]